MGMELRSGVPINRTGGVMLKLCGNESACGLGRIIASDPRLCVPFQLRESDGHGLPMSRTNSVVASDQCCE